MGLYVIQLSIYKQLLMGRIFFKQILLIPLESRLEAQVSILSSNVLAVLTFCLLVILTLYS